MSAVLAQVNPGDTLWDIARHYGTTEAQLIKANRLDGSHSHIIHAGDELVIPRQPKFHSLKTLSGKLDVFAGDDCANNCHRLSGGSVRGMRAQGPSQSKYFNNHFTLSADVDTLRWQFRHLLEAMRWVETSHIMPAPVGDNGMSIGPLQISR